jgi:peptidyl-prolyl cis-trans isomerase D
MLQKIRNNIQGTIAKIIVAFIAIPFAVFGIDAFFTGGVPEVARVNGEVITEPELAQGIELERRRLLSQMQDNVDSALLDEQRLRGPVLDSLIERKLLRQLAEQAGFRAGDSMINQVIVDDETFHDNGVFSQGRFQGILASNGMSPALFKQMLGEEIVITQLIGGVAASEFVTEPELRDIARITQQTLDVRYLTLPVAEYTDDTEVPVSRIAEYYETNKSDFQTLEVVRLEYLELRLEDMFQPVEEADLLAEYDRRMKAFEAQTERLAAHIMLTSLGDDEAKQRLNELRDRTVAGEDFAQLATEHSEDSGSAANGGELGFSAGDAFPAEFEAALALLQPGEVSQPVQTQSGWHLVKLLEMRAQDAPSFEEMRSEIETALQRREAEPKFVERSEQLADLSFNSDGLAEAATALGLEVKVSPELGRRGVEGLFSDARIIAAAFSKDVLQEKQNSELIELDAEHALVLRLQEHKPSRQMELAEVEEQIRTLLTESMVREKVLADGEVILAALKAGQSIEENAVAGGREWQQVLKHRRGAPELASEVSDAVFTTARGADGRARGRIVLAGGDVVVFETANFEQGRLEDLSAEQQVSLRSLLQRGRGREVAGHYQERLRQSADIELL